MTMACSIAMTKVMEHCDDKCVEICDDKDPEAFPN